MHLFKGKKLFSVFLLFLLSIIIVGCQAPEEANRLEQLKDSLNISKTTDVKLDFPIAKYLGLADGEGNYDHVITWTSNNTSTISIGGLDNSGKFYIAAVTRQETDVTVTLTATITLIATEETTTKQFEITVSAVTQSSTEYDTTEEAKAKAEGTTVSVSGTVSYVNEKGFFVVDDEGSIYVYLNTTHSYIQGDVVTVSGTRANYNNMPQIGYQPSAPTIVKSTNSTYNLVGEEIEFSEVNAKTVTDTDFFSKTIKLTGVIETSTDYNTPYKIKHYATTDSVGINTYSMAAAKTQLSGLVGQYVEITAIVYIYTTYWSVLFVEGTAVPKTMPTLNDQQKVDFAESSLLSTFDGKKFNSNLTLPTSLSGATISWESNNSAITNTGVYTAPEDTDVTVTLTATIVSNSVQKVVNITVIAAKEVDPTALHVIINQVYGGGGNSGSTYKNDFIELYNPTDSAVSLAGWSVQYASKTGTSWTVTTLSGSIAAGGYYLIQQAQGSGGTVNLPTPDAIGTIAMSSADGKVALVSVTTALTGTNPTSNLNVVDFIGYGIADAFEGSAAAPVLTNTTAAIRNNFMDSDNNSLDFTTAAPNPRNSSSS